MADDKKTEKRKNQNKQSGAKKGVFGLNDFLLLRIGMNSTI